VLNFGLSAPIDVQISDTDFSRSSAVAKDLLQAMRKIPGVVDPHIVQVLDYPALQVKRRSAAARALLGVSQRDVANNLLTSLSSSTVVRRASSSTRRTTSIFRAVQMPVANINTVDDLMKHVDERAGQRHILDARQRAQRAGDAACRHCRAHARRDVRHRSITTPFSASSMSPPTSMPRPRRDRGDIQGAIDALKQTLPSTTHLDIRGQNEVMQTSFRSLALGLVLAIVLVYALLVVLFQSWLDPFIIMMAVPGRAHRHPVDARPHPHDDQRRIADGRESCRSASRSPTRFLVVSFANDIRARENLSPIAAAIAAGRTRLRPVLMTALAMIIRHGPDGAGPRRGGRAERAVGPRRHRRAGGGDARDVVRGADLLYAAAPQAAATA